MLLDKFLGAPYPCSMGGTAGERAGTKFGANVRLIRNERGLTLLDLQRRTGIDQGHIAKIERQEVVPLITTAVELADALYLGLDEIIRYEPR